jgi:uncharacterized protein (TIGR02271 family)
MDRDATNRTPNDITGINEDDEALRSTTRDVDTDIVNEADETLRRKTASTLDLDDEKLTFSLAEEHLRADVRERQVGTVSISKRTEELPVEADIDVQHDEVHVEHREINEPMPEARDPWYEGDTLVVPVYEEVLVTEKRLYLKEEIRITLVKATEQVHVQDTVRRQVVDVVSDVDDDVDEGLPEDR